MAKHYLTFEYLSSCTVNGQTVESGYELKDGDVIVATAAVVAGYYFTVNGDSHTNGVILDITNSDIDVGISSSGGAVN